MTGTDAGEIIVTGAREHNLKGISLAIPRDRLTVFTGVSGSGKSSVVFGTIAVESQRQLNDTFPAFVRNRLPRYERPAAETIANLSTAIVVDQRPVGDNARSTVGTMTDIHPMLRVLFSRYATPSAGESNRYSFNDPAGMCADCEGLGTATRIDLGRLLDDARSLNDGAIRFPAYAVGSAGWQLFAESGLFDPDRPVREFSAEERETLLHGGGFTVKRASRNGVYNNRYEGLVTNFTRRYLRGGTQKSDRHRAEVDAVVIRDVCPTCRGARLNADALASVIDGRSIADLTALEIGDLIEFVSTLDNPVAGAAATALRRIDAVGLGYLTLDRRTGTLSGGETQRLKTVRHLGSSLVGLTYIFDEPSVGLHPRDVGRLTTMLRALRDAGNTVLVVEHDEDVIDIADHVVDLGPGAGEHGGEVVFTGTVEQLRVADTTTGRELRRAPRLNETPRRPGGWLSVRDARQHNLTGVDVDIPTGVLTAVTGVAGSGKSTLARRALVEAHPEAVVVDQAQIGGSPRSTPATYLDIMDTLRRLFAAATGQPPGMFSFNSTGGCPACHGRGEIRTDLAFLDPVTRVCEVCEGRRFRAEVLDHRLDGRSIVDVLAATVTEAREFLTDDAVRVKLALLADVGLAYLTLGQPLSTLSGGERQRLKLANELRSTGSVYVLDEPTAGLHRADVDALLALLDRLVDAGNTVVVVEHDLTVVRHADWVVDLGPEAGRHGGRVVFTGPPAELAESGTGHTAEYLRRSLRRR